MLSTSGALHISVQEQILDPPSFCAIMFQVILLIVHRIKLYTKACKVDWHYRVPILHNLVYHFGLCTLCTAQFGVSLETQWHKMKEGVLGLLEPRKIIIIRICLHPWPANTKGFPIKL